MAESSNGRNRLLAILLIGLTIAGLWSFMRQPSTQAAVDDTLDAFVPGSMPFKRNLDTIEQARQVTDLINARRTFPDESLE